MMKLGMMKLGMMKFGLGIAAAFAAMSLGAASAGAAVTVTGTVGATGKYLVTGSPVALTGSAANGALIKIVFGNLTPGTNVSLCAGTTADFSTGACPMRLSDSGGPGFNFLTITDAGELGGKILYVLRAVGTAPAQFTLTVE